jgi:hypothetical protein
MKILKNYKIIVFLLALLMPYFSLALALPPITDNVANINGSGDASGAPTSASTPTNPTPATSSVIGVNGQPITNMNTSPSATGTVAPSATGSSTPPTTSATYTPIFGECSGSNKNLANCIASVYDWSIGIGSAVAILMIIIAGYSYATSAGEVERINKAKEMVIGSITGLILLLLVVLILQVLHTGENSGGETIVPLTSTSSATTAVTTPTTTTTTGSTSGTTTGSVISGNGQNTNVNTGSTPATSVNNGIDNTQTGAGVGLGGLMETSQTPPSSPTVDSISGYGSAGDVNATNIDNIIKENPYLSEQIKP